ncbi:MAG: DUF559 domain-containing protein [Desulfurellales bacterium]|nr:MAG: DUF559 domain-containing protein [Desulfurellales bacterium]
MAMKLPLAVQSQSLGLPAPVQEYRFHPERGWMFDFAWVDHRIAIEVDGGTWKPGGGRHNRAKGYEEDARKLNAATELGWAVYRYTTRQVANGEAMVQIERVLRRAIDGDLSDGGERVGGSAG